MFERSGTSLVAVIPDGADVMFGPGEFREFAYFMHPEHPARVIEITELNAARPMNLEDWLALGEELSAYFTPA